MTNAIASASEQRVLRYWQAEAEALAQAMRRDPRIILLGEDIAGGAGREDIGIVEAWGGPYGTTRGLATEFGRNRVIDTPISEAGFLGAAAGLAESGYRPLVEIMFPVFFGVCLDQLVTNIAQKTHLFGARRKMPVVVKSLINDHGVLYSLLAHIPGLRIVAPSSPYTVKGLLMSALQSDDPVVVFDNIALLRREGAVPELPYEVPIGESVVANEGYDITLIGISAMTTVCLDAARLLRDEGVSAEVIDLLSIAPIDEATLLRSVRKTGRVIVVDEGFPRCSVARDVVAMISERAFRHLRTAPFTLNSRAEFRPFSKALSQSHIPTVSQVVDAAQRCIKDPSTVVGRTG